MAEAVGAVAAVVGLLSSIVTLYESCSKGYSKFTNARDIEKTYATLFMKLRIEEARFHVWGRRWGIRDGKLVEEVEVAEVLRRVVEDVLQQMDRLLQDSVQLSTKYGVRETGAGADATALDCSLCSSTSSPGAIYSSSRSSDTNKTQGKQSSALTLSLRKRASWAISDKDKFEVLVSELRYFNDSLYAVFPLPIRRYLVQAALPSEMLRTDNGSELRAIYEAASGSYDLLALSANIRHLNTTQGRSSSFTGNLTPAMLKIARSEIELEGATNNATASTATASVKRALGFYTVTNPAPSVPPGRKRVMIEWRAFGNDPDEDFAPTLYSRVENLTRLLHPATRKPSSFGALDCLGFYPDYVNSRYGFVYSFPGQETAAPVTLHQLLVNKASTPTAYPARPHLGARFALARRIATSLLQLHASGWLHKGLSSHNILLFMPTTSENEVGHAADDEESLSQAWIAGFDYARPDDLRELSEMAARDPETDIYRHRLVLEGTVRYRRAFDIYSLGLVLLEIGLWIPLKDIYKTKYTPEIFKQRLEQYYFPPLAFATGKTYESVVRRCLNYGFNSGGAIELLERDFDAMEISAQDGFCWDLVKDLEKCCV